MDRHIDTAIEKTNQNRNDHGDKPQQTTSKGSKEITHDLTTSSKVSTSECSSNLPNYNNCYRDFSKVEPSGDPQSSKVSNFPSNLHLILSSSSFQDVVEWMPHGRSWRIIKSKKFENEVIPLFYRHKSLSSFMRQVYGWGFRRIFKGPDRNSFYHERFLRGLPHLCTDMRRMGKDQYQYTQLPYPLFSPDFYAISKDHPLPEIVAATNPSPNNDTPELDYIVDRSDTELDSSINTENSPCDRRQNDRDEIIASVIRNPGISSNQYRGLETIPTPMSMHHTLISQGLNRSDYAQYMNRAQINQANALMSLSNLPTIPRAPSLAMSYAQSAHLSLRYQSILNQELMRSQQSVRSVEASNVNQMKINDLEEEMALRRELQRSYDNVTNGFAPQAQADDQERILATLHQSQFGRKP